MWRAGLSAVRYRTHTDERAQRENGVYPFEGVRKSRDTFESHRISAQRRADPGLRTDTEPDYHDEQEAI